MTPRHGALAERFTSHFWAGGEVLETDTVVVALSGGVDSVSLLHLLRFPHERPDGSAPRGPRLVAAHVDHGMREGSAEDASWVRALTEEWDVRFRTTRLEPAPTGEAGARLLRYGFLEEVRTEEEARWVLTAHHADDQAETVLFRVLRGTGISGLRGIRSRREPALWRPLLPFWRNEILAYAEEHGLAWREDPTNRAPFARNVLRHRLLPEAEASVAPAARRSLAALSRHAGANEEAWSSLMPSLLGAIDTRSEDTGLSVSRAGLCAHHPEVRARLIRALVRQLGATLSRAGTRLAVEFTRSGDSGTAIPVTGTLTLRRELDRFLLARGRPSCADVSVRIGEGSEGEAEATLGGSVYRVRWSLRDVVGADWQEAFPVGSMRFPLTVRAWQAGDRAVLSYGTKKLKKLFLEARVPVGQRHRTPVLEDAAGRILWVPDIVRASSAYRGVDAEGGVLHIGISHADSD